MNEDNEAFCELVDELADARRAINAQRAEIARLTERCDAYSEVEKAARKLANETLGILTAAEPMLREAIGNTNYAVLSLKARETEEALAALASPAPSPSSKEDDKKQ